MPKLPGRQSHRLTIDLEDVEVASFVGVWEHYVFKKPCQVTGCDHIVSGIRNSKTMLYETCGEGSGAAVAFKKSAPDDQRQNHYAICVCCLDKLDAMWKAAHGDPE
jgi:hypothetical protein